MDNSQNAPKSSFWNFIRDYWFFGLLGISIVVLLVAVDYYKQEAYSAQTEISTLRAEAAMHREQFDDNQEILLEVVKAKDRKIDQLNQEIANRPECPTTAANSSFWASREDLAAEAAERKKLEDKLHAKPVSSAPAKLREPAVNQPPPASSPPAPSNKPREFLPWAPSTTNEPARRGLAPDMDGNWYNQKLSFRPNVCPTLIDIGVALSFTGKAASLGRWPICHVKICLPNRLKSVIKIDVDTLNKI